MSHGKRLQEFSWIIYIDEAQDFTREWAEIVNHMLRGNSSKLGVFYDDVQIFREDSFGNAFAIDGQPYLLRENIRNTANIYRWTSEKTNLGIDVIANPVEGPNVERFKNILLLTLNY